MTTTASAILRCSAALALAWAPMPDLAEADPAEPLEVIQVSATRRPESAFDVPTATNVVGLDAIRASTPQTVMDLLHGRAGTYVQQTTPGQGVVIVRGLKGSEVLQLVDGFRLGQRGLPRHERRAGRAARRQGAARLPPRRRRQRGLPGRAAPALRRGLGRAHAGAGLRARGGARRRAGPILDFLAHTTASGTVLRKQIEPFAQPVIRQLERLRQSPAAMAAL